MMAEDRSGKGNQKVRVKDALKEDAGRGRIYKHSYKSRRRK